MLIKDLKKTKDWNSEAAFQGDFTRFLRSPEGATWFHSLGNSGAWFELKLLGPTERTLPFSRIAYHQLEALWQAKHGLLSHKVSDMALGLKPADCVVISGGGGYLVVGLRVGRAYILDIDNVRDLIELSGGTGSIKLHDLEN